MKVRNRLGPLLSCAVLSVVAGKSHADAWQKEPSYGIELGYNDNYTLEPERESSEAKSKIQAVSTVKATAGLSLIQLKPAYTATISGKLIATAYSGDTEGYGVEKGSVVGAVLDERVDGFFNVGLEGRRERSQWRFDAGLSADSLLQSIDLDATDTVEQGGSGNSDNEDGVVRDDVGRLRLTLTPSYLFRLSPISLVRGSLTLSNVKYENTENASLEDYEEQKLALFYSREFSPVNTWSADGELRNYDASNAGRFDSAVLGLGVSHKFTETIDFGLRVAQSTTSFEYQIGNESGGVDILKGRNSKPLVQLTGSKNAGRMNYSVRMGTELYGSGTGDVVKADELLFNVTFQHTELMTFTWRSKLFQNKSLRELVSAADGEELSDADKEYNAGIEDTNRRYLAFEPTVNWQFSRWWVMDAGYRYQHEKRDGDSNPGKSNYAFVGVTFSKPIEGKNGLQ